MRMSRSSSWTDIVDGRVDLTQSRASLLNISVHLVLAASIGACGGALALGLGVYFASYTDRIAPFYAVGAIAGLATGVAFVISGVARTPMLSIKKRRLTLPALVGALTLWTILGGSSLGMSLADRTIASLLWLLGSRILLWAISR